MYKSSSLKSFEPKFDSKFDSSEMLNVKTSGNKGPGVNLWLRSEIFNIGPLPIPPNSRLTHNNIKKIIPYIKGKDKKTYPNLSYSIWKHIACNKLSYSQEMAWVYFWVFDLFSDKSEEDRILRWDSVIYNDAEGNINENGRNPLTVEALPFTLFLFIQHLHKISLKASLVTGSDEWPSRNKSPDADGKLNNSWFKSSDETSHQTFILNNLNEMLELLVDYQATDSSPSRSHSHSGDPLISRYAVQCLGLLINGEVNKSSSNGREIKSLPELAIMEASKSGYIKASDSFSFRKLQTWLKSNLGQNPFGASACLVKGRNLCWMLQGDTKENWIEKKRGTITTNATYTPKNCPKGNKLILLSQVTGMTIARSSSTLNGATVKISRCNDSFIYLLSPLRSVTLEKCQRSTVVLGAVEVSVDMHSCQNLTVVVATRRFTIQSSKQCTMHLLTPNTPLIFHHNSDLVFAPYNTSYRKLEEHMFMVGLAPTPNLWDKPVLMGDGTEEGVFRLMRPQEFCNTIIPFRIDGNTSKNPIAIPERYQAALAHKLQRIKGWNTCLDEAALQPEQRSLLSQTVQAKFQEWLQTSGYARLLEDLVMPPVNPAESAG